MLFAIAGTMACKKEKLRISEPSDNNSLAQSSAPGNNDKGLVSDIILKTEPRNTGYSFRVKYTKDKIKTLAKIVVEIEINNEWYTLTHETKETDKPVFRIPAGEKISQLLTDGKFYTVFVTSYDETGKQIGKTETFSVEAKEKSIKIKDKMVWSEGHDTRTKGIYGNIRVYFNLPRPKSYYQEQLEKGDMLLTFNGRIQYRKSGSLSKAMDISTKFFITDLQENDNGQVYTDISFGDPNNWNLGVLEGTLSLIDSDAETEAETEIDESEISQLLFDKSESPDFLTSRIYSTDKGLTWNIEMTIADRGGWGDSMTCKFEKPSDKNTEKPFKGQMGMQYTGTDKAGNEVYRATLSSKEDNVKFDAGTTYSYNVLVFRLGSGTRTSAGTASSKAELL